jgi:transcriptional regulator NrdR family protein
VITSSNYGIIKLQAMNIKVQKRNGSIEDYDPNKIKRVVIAAGLNEEEAEKLVQAVNRQIEERGKTQVTSIQIRDQVIIEIQKLNRNAANKFIWYEKLRDKSFNAENK